MTFLYYVSYYKCDDMTFTQIMLVEKPRKLAVLNHLVCIYAKWREIGNGLGLSSNFLTSLAQSLVSDKIKLEHVIQEWIQLDGQCTSDGQSTPVNWKTIIDVIKGPIVDNKALSIKIYQYLKQHQTTSKYIVFNRHHLTS